MLDASGEAVRASPLRRRASFPWFKGLMAGMKVLEGLGLCKGRNPPPPVALLG